MGVAPKWSAKIWKITENNANSDVRLFLAWREVTTRMMLRVDSNFQVISACRQKISEEGFLT